MDLILISKGNKYAVQDKKGRVIYTIKKKAFSSGKFILYDSSDYALYSFRLTGSSDGGKKPEYSIILNEKTFMDVICKSFFLDPSFECKGKQVKDNYNLLSENRRDFKIIKNGTEIGSILTKTSANGDLQYDIIVEDKEFDDYIPLFGAIIDQTFGDINKKT